MRWRHPREAPLQFALLLVCFFLSGFAGLLYETSWAREFEFVFGTSELAVVSVLAAYMGGLAAGSAVAGRVVPRVRRPVLWYGLLELGIAAGALAVPWAIRAATGVLTLAVGGRSSPPSAGEVSAALFYVVAAFLVLVVPTGMMGATLPLLARHAVRRDEEVGVRVGVLYAVNTLGAVVGTTATAFLLLPSLGLRATVYAGAATNAIVFAAAALLSTRAAAAGAGQTASPVHPARFHWVLPATAVSGAVSFGYEVLWTRLLGQIVGGTIQGFATMLGSFLLGIALGSALASRAARDPIRAARGFAVAQLGIAGFSLLAFLGVERVPELARAIGAGSAGAFGGNALLAGMVLLPPSLCIGAVFPFAVRLLARDETEAGPAAARVYVWNTLGSIGGALAVGFFLLPALRFEGVLSLGIAINLMLGLGAALATRPVRKLAAGAALAALAALAIVRPQTPWSVLRHSAMLGSNATWTGDVSYYGVGRSSTVLLLDQQTGWRLATNGLPESVIDADRLAPSAVEPARWLGILPPLLRPGLRDMLVIGLGGGITLDAVPSSVESVTVIELEEEIVHAHEWLAEHLGRSPLHDPRVRLVVNDARGALLLTDARFDAIVSQPSHPWTAGASHLYTREFFELAAAHLEPGGVFVQWIGLAFVDEELLRSLVATLVDVFPHVAVFRPQRGAVLFAASDQPIDPVATAARAIAAAPADYARFSLRVPEDVAYAWELGGEDARSFAAGAAVITDDRNPLATRSASIGDRTLGRRRRAALLFHDYEPLETHDGLDPAYLARRIADGGDPERAVRFARAQSDRALRFAALGWANHRTAPARAKQAFLRAIREDPDGRSARWGLIESMQRQVERGDPQALELAAPLDGTAAVVVEGWQRAASGAWSDVAALDAQLAAADPRDPAQHAALRLRIEWRIESADPARRAELDALAADLVADGAHPPDVLLAARALAAAGKPGDALGLVDYLSRQRRVAGERSSALALLAKLRPDVDPERWETVRERFERRRR